MRVYLKAAIVILIFAGVATAALYFGIKPNDQSVGRTASWRAFSWRAELF